MGEDFRIGRRAGRAYGNHRRLEAPLDVVVGAVLRIALRLRLYESRFRAGRPRREFRRISNYGAVREHYNGVPVWVNFVDGGPDAEKVTLSQGREGSAAGEWADDGYVFKGLEYYRLSGKVYLRNALTAEFAVEYGGCGGLSKDILLYPVLFGTIDKDEWMHVFYNRYNDVAMAKWLKFKLLNGEGVYQGVDNMGPYITCSYNGTQSSVGSGGDYEWKSLTKTREIGTHEYAIGTSRTDNTERTDRIFIGTIKSICLHNRVLDKDEFLRNRRIDDIRFCGIGDIEIVNGEVCESGVKGQSSLPDGVYNIDEGEAVITAAVHENQGVRYCPRLFVETYVSGEWVLRERRWTDSCTISKESLGADRLRLTWTWGVRPGFYIIVR